MLSSSPDESGARIVCSIDAARRLLDTGSLVVRATDGAEMRFMAEDVAGHGIRITAEHGAVRLGFVDSCSASIGTKFGSWSEPAVVSHGKEHGYHGVGRALLTLAMGAAVCKGHTEFSAYGVWPDAADRFYGGLGFVELVDNSLKYQPRYNEDYTSEQLIKYSKGLTGIFRRAISAETLPPLMISAEGDWPSAALPRRPASPY